MFKLAAEEEMEWADYLFKDGSMLGLNSDILKKYMMFLTNSRLKAIGIDPIFEKTNNPINWINAWTNSESLQVAPQESEIESYNKAAVNNDLGDSDFGDFDF
jgi:ribonucleoside-diphosphate reductase beta chain